MMLIIMSFGFRLVQRQTAKYNEFVFVFFHLRTKNLSSFPLLSPPSWSFLFASEIINT